MKDLEIKSKVFWVKIVDFLQQNWALIEPTEEGNSVVVYFIHDGSVIFDKIEFESFEEAEAGLRKNGFKTYLDENETFTDFMAPPKRPFGESSRPIYSSGEYWKK